jgi:uncharacterized protein YbjT (DUF2867 family)
MSESQEKDRTTGRSVLLAGATGLVGQHILEGLLADETVAAVHVLGRREVSVRHPKMAAQMVDFAALPGLPPLDEVYLALGTTIKAAGSQAAFRAVDFDANLAVARAARSAGAGRCGLVSAMGADAKSSVFYNRVKGELEEALEKLSFAALVIARPSLLVGDRGALGQPDRALESVAMKIGSLFGRLFPSNYRPIAAADVARALLARVPTAKGHTILLSGEMQP